MARLSASQRKNLKPSDFIYPKQRAYPIHDENHAKAALFMAARKDTKGNLAAVRRAVARKFPHLVKKKG